MNSKNSSYRYKVIIADDHQFFRDGFEIALKQIDAVKKITHAVNGKEVLKILKNEKYDLVFMDIKMPEMNGIETTKEIELHYPRVKVIALSMSDDRKSVVEMFNSGASGYIIKNTDKKEIETAIKKVMAGEHYFAEPVAKEFMETLIQKQKKVAAIKPAIKITEREIAVLMLLCKGYSNAGMAQKLFITEKTIEFHRGELLRKTNSKNAAELVIWATRNGYCVDL
jgi:DNA-binding NarL/FixJ family response regulator